MQELAVSHLSSAFAFVACVALLAGPPGTSQAPEPTAAISGVVVDGPTRRPVAGATVSLRAIGGDGPARRQGRQLTDDLGRFVFARLPGPEDFDLTVSKSGYLPGAFGQDSVGSLMARRIVLDAGEWLADARVVIWRPGAISGRVVDEAGEPMVDVVVRVLTHVIVAGRPHLAMGGIGRTDDLGQYRVSGLHPGRYLVSVPSVQSSVPADTPGHIIAGESADGAASSEALGRQLRVSEHPLIATDPSTWLVLGGFGSLPVAGGGGRAYPTVFHPGVATIADASPVEVSAGQERSGIDLRLAPGPTVRVTGRVAGPSEALSGLTVRLIPSGAESIALGSEAATALVAADGAFAMSNVPAGNYTLLASHTATTALTMASGASVPVLEFALPGFATVESRTLFTAASGVRYVSISSGGPGEYAARQALTIGSTDVTDVAVTLRPGASIAGRIVWDRRPGAANPPVTSVLTVRAWPANGDASLGFPSGRTTPRDFSSFVVQGFQPGEYLLDTFAPGGLVKSIAWLGRDYTARPLDMRPGGNITDVVITLTTEAAALTGTVRTPARAPAGTGAVLCFPVDRALWSMPSPEGVMRNAWAPTSTSGAFRIGSLRGGEYHVIAVDHLSQQDLNDPAFLAAAAPLASRVTLEWGASATVALTMQTVRVRR